MINILFEDDYFIAVEKPAHMLTHPYKKESNERINLLFTVRDQIGQYLYPVHRLDRQTSGIVLFGKKPEAIREIQELWHTDHVIKKYKSIVRGELTEKGQINFALNNERKEPQDALTLYEPLEVFKEASYLEIEIKTGKRHQIRRHFSRRMMHVFGDRKYGKKKYNDYYLEHYKLERLFLHAHYLKFFHPFLEKTIEIHSSLPFELENCLELLRKDQ